MRNRFELFVETSGVEVAAGLQGAPLVRFAGATAQQARVPVDWWISDEENVLSAEVSPVEDAPHASLAIALVDPSDRFDPLAIARWRWPVGALTEPFALRLPFSVSLASPAFADLDAVSSLEPSDLAAIHALVGGLVDAISRRDAAALVGLLAHRLRDFCAVFDDDLEEHRAVVHDDFAEMLRVMSLDPVLIDDVRVTPCAGDRVFHIAKADGTELLVLRNAEGESVMQVYVGRADGRWRVVR